MIIGSKIIIREKKLADAWDDYTWESDPQLAHFDAAPPIDLSFSEYLSSFIKELRLSLPTSRRFGIDTLDGEHIGNCSYYNINETRRDTEVGIMIGKRDFWGKGYGSDCVATLVKYVFENTRLERVYLKTLDNNFRAQKCFEKCGFLLYGHMSNYGYNFTLMEQYKKVTSNLIQSENQQQGSSLK